MDLQQVLSALEKADAAGDTQSAQALADLAKSLMAGQNLQAPSTKPAGFSLSDIATSFGQGAVGSTEALTNVAGAGNVASQYLSGVSESLGKQYTPERQAEIERQKQRMKKAEESGSTWEEIKAAAQNIYEAPLQSAAQGLGSFVPYAPAILAGPVAAALGLTERAAVAAAAVARAYAPVVGTAQGAGSVKGAIYDAVYQAEKESGTPDAEAKQKADAAQDYTGKNLDQIALGAGLGFVASKSGAEKFLTKEGREKAAEKLLPRVGKAIGEESLTEGAQGGQERLASNIALQRTGRDIPTWQGVGGQAAQEAIIGGLTSGPVAAVSGRAEAKPEVKPEVTPDVTPKVTPEVTPELEQLTPEQKRILAQQRAVAEPPEDVLGGIQKQIQTAAPTTPEDIARIKDEHETAIIEGLLNQDAERIKAHEDAQAQIRQQQQQARSQIQEQSALETMDNAIAGTDARVRESRLLSRVQDLIESNTPFASTAINDINAKFKLINEAPLTEQERARVQNIMGMAQAFTNFVNLPQAPVKPVDTFAENQQMEQLIKERKAREQLPTEPIRATPAAPSPVVQEAPISQGAGEGAAPRPPSGTQPSTAEDSERELSYLATLPDEPPFVEATPIEGEPMPKSLDEIELERKVDEQTKPIYDYVEQITKKPLNLFGVLRGQLSKSEVIDISPDFKFIALRKSAKKGRGADLSDLVQSGSLDEFLPPRLRMGLQNQDELVDESEAVEYIKDKLRTEQNYTYDTEVALRQAFGSIKDAEDSVKEFLRIEDANELLAEEAAKQRAIDKEAEIAAEKGDDRTIAEGVSEDLKAPTPEELRAKETRAKAEEKRIADEKKAAEAKAKADAEVSEFTLTGSDRPADVAEAAGQKPMFSLRGKAAEQVSAFEQSLRTLLNKFGLKDVGLKLAQGMRDEGSYAAKLIQIANDSANPIRTLRHEAIHALRELGFFTDAQWNSLSKMAKDKWIDQYLKQRNIDGKPLKAGEESRYDAYMREYKGDMEKITEEAVADAFADFDATKAPAGMLQAILQKLRNLFQSIKTALTKVEAPEKIFGKVEKGELKPEAQRAATESKSLRDRATDNFKRWFGDSKVVDENGEPLVVYHGTPYDNQGLFKDMRNGRFNLGFHFGTKQAANDLLDSVRYDYSEGKHILPVYLSIKNPIEFDIDYDRGFHKPSDLYQMIMQKAEKEGVPGVTENDIDAFYRDEHTYKGKSFTENVNEPEHAQLVKDWITKKLGFDGFKYINAAEDPGSVSWIALEPTQIKSAIGNNGEYSLTDADIRKSLRDRATDNFKRWFGDSKVLDIDGSPLVMYTGTSKDVDFTKFKIPKNGAWFTYDPKTASQYAKENDSKDIKYNPDTRRYEEVNTADRVMPVYLRIENPAKLSKEDSDAMRYASNYRKVQGQIFDKLRAKGHDGVDMGDGVWVAIGQPTQIKSAIGNYGEYSLKDADIRKSLRTTPLQDGEQALDIIKSMGRTTEKPDESYKAKVQQAWNNAKDNPETTAKAVKDTLTRWSDQVQTWAFSSDAALNNSIRRAINETATTDAERTAFLLNTSLSQTVHADALASLFITEGNIKYNKDLHKWEAVKDKDNLVTLVKGLEDISKKYNLSKEEAQLIGHTAFETKRLKSLVEFNDKVTQEVADMRKEAAQLRKEGKNRAADSLYEKATKRQKETKFIHMTDEEIASGNKLFDTIPELNNLVKTWNGIRSNAVKVLVETGLWSETDADFLLSNADYVPFFREDQLENGKGPKEFIRGLQVQAQEKKLKGSNKPVNDIFDNMVRWTQYSINRGVRNRSAVSLAEAAAEMGMARKVPVRAGNQNVVRVWNNGEEVLYSMDDPMFIPAFTGLESVAIPSWKILSKFSNMLRQSVVMYPLFSISQVPQDSFAAIFTSGLKPQYALRIPVLAVKELIKTLAGKSKTHEELKKFGAVGVRDFTADMARVDAEVLAGLKMEKGLWSKVKGTLHHIAMASDNAVRQATYEAAMAQGLSQSEAIEKSFEVWNVRRKGSSQTLALAGQIIPFFNAYLAAQNVAFNVITGKGISPQKRADAYKTLAATTASVMTLSLLYTMMNGDDEDYENKPAVQRDRLLMIPGSGGMSIPLRSDLYTLPKILTEHTYLLMTDKGYEDGRKFRDSIKAALASSFLSPTTVPQAVKPLVEVGINYDFFTGRPIIGQFQKKLEVERQFNDSTAELAKALGSTGLVSPLNAEHLIRGMFGSVGGLILYATNPVLHSDPNVERPTLSAKEMLATLPGTSGFITRENQSALKNDFYVLRDEVAKVASTIADLKARSPEKLEEYLSSEEVIAKYGISKAVNKMVEQLGKIRKEMTRVTNAPADAMTGEEKESTLKELRQVEKDMLKSINVKELRAAAGL